MQLLFLTFIFCCRKDDTQARIDRLNVTSKVLQNCYSSIAKPVYPHTNPDAMRASLKVGSAALDY